MHITDFQTRINAGNYDKKLIWLYGEDELAHTKERYIHALSAFAAHYPDDEEIDVISTPGRTEICGNHTDHNGGLVMAGSVNRDIIGIASKNDSNTMRLISEGYPEISISSDDLTPKKEEEGTSAALLRGVASKMRDNGYAVGGFDCFLTSNVPGGAGLSSSAAFEVELCSVISHLYNDGRLSPVESALISQYAENHFFGKACGLMDQIACAVGGMLMMDFADPKDPAIETIDFDFASAKHALFLIETGGSHADLSDDYTAIRTEMHHIASLLGEEQLRSCDPDVFYESIPRLREEAGDRAVARAYHYFNENERVRSMRDALNRKDFSAFKEILFASGRSSLVYLQNAYSLKKYDEQGLIVALLAAEHILQGVGAYRLHGGGFAGTIQAFVPTDQADRFALEISKIFGEGSCHRTMIRPVGTTRIN